VAEASQIRYAKTGDGFHIAYQVLGEGPLDLLVFSMALIPIDMADDEPSLARFQRRLAAFGRVIRFDPRGVGLSDPVSPSIPPTLEQWVDDALAVLDAAGSKRAAVFSPGSPVALLLAASHPERVSSLVLINGLARAASAPDYPIGAPPEALDAFIDSAMQALESEGPGEDALAEIESAVQLDALEKDFDILTVIAPTMLGNEEFRRWWDRAGQRGASPATARAFIRVFFEADVRKILRLIQAPTLILHRKDNLFIPVEHGRYLAAHIPNATYIELPGADNLYWVGDADGILDDTEEFLTGVRHGAEPDRRLASVLFTDIVSSTERLVEVGERRWRDLLDGHDAAVRRQLERFGGREIKTTGDGVLAIFDGPARSVYCACAIRQTVSQLGLDIRAGIHAGEVEIRGKDVGGLAVVIAARVAALAGPREVLASSTVKDLVAGSSIGFKDRGSHLLKGVPDEWRLFSVESA
jgi:class 3 adenylate cyclase/alpha-beta hydrolase superfamily lysophospholipase